MSWRAAALALLVFACGPKLESDRPGPVDASTTGYDQDNDEPIGVGADGCPERFSMRMVDAPCEGGTPRCSYAEAVCDCAIRPPCTGVDMSMHPDHVDDWVWSCTISDASLVRADGCPALAPAAGERCGRADRVCEYAPWCFGAHTTARCRRGRWEREDVFIDPPP